jgi:hypothetical protein
MLEKPLRIRAEHARRDWRWRLPGLIWCMLALFSAGPARAEEGFDGARLMFQVSPLVVHFSPSPEHNNFPRLLGLEYETRAHWVAGGASFLNSFEQPSSYWYIGKRWFLDSIHENFYIKLTAGVLLGYDEPYEDKIPLNDNGIAFAPLPAVGYQHERFNAQLVLLGGSGLMLMLGYDIVRWD